MYTNKNFHKLFFDIKVEDYFNYIEFMESNIESRKSKIIKLFEHQSEGMDEETKQKYYEFAFFDDYYDLEKTHSYILRKSLFITLYSFMESELMKVAQKLEKKNLNKIKLSDISHIGTQKYFFFINTVLSIELDISQKTVLDFITFNNLRNYFVHSDGKTFNQQKYNSFKTLSGITFEDYPRRDFTHYTIESLDKQFNEGYLSLISHFFDKLYSALERSGISL